MERRRGIDRAVTVHEGCEARHGFAFGAHYDPANAFFGALLAHNEERLAPGAGYPRHAHHEADLVTWVVEGELQHSDSLGNARTVRPGTVQVLSAGTGVEHAELSAVGTRFVQSWLVPDALAPPELRSRDLSEELASGSPVLVAAGASVDTFALPAPVRAAEGSPAPERAEQRSVSSPLSLRRADAALWAARLPAAAVWELTPAPFVHVYLAAGSATVPPGEVGEGDELRLTDEGVTLTAGDRGAEVLVWTMGSDLRP
ncbi:pirin family protein [Pseudonocardia pini]|uniref:pirin family protein n=1 Tax=Pseudonocardia pini TaxID=2758030 RepID=UPI0015F08203|nr:pirin family protein [Pseudonocardia pini]